MQRKVCRRQSPYSRGPMFKRARSMASESGEPAYVVYDYSEHSYYAQTSIENVDGVTIVLVAEVIPKR